ncbi:uncharacterized protein LOC123316902 [Coccinella septempunctata]|uniref:uncharacterized protein LOC123316902 n=1 Tax=Coccinella septempunctata TaxID=41139 RepID=UPI001D06B92E|nr:uncharacterized protein LOC123316902 [Coccinella septempunctata]
MGVQTRLLFLIFCSYGCSAIPSSMIDQIKAREMRPNKVKRVSIAAEEPEESLGIGNHYYGNPTAIKRGTEMKNEAADDESSDDNDWSPSEQAIYQNVDNDFQSTVYNDESSQSANDMDDYDKGLQYGNREKFDEAIENAVLKSEFYGNLEGDKKKRKKRNSRQYSFGNSAASDDLSPEEVLDLLTLYESERQKPEDTLSNLEQDNSIWLDVPVRPGAILPSSSNFGPAYHLDRSPSNFEKSRWSDTRNNKRFMVAKKRNDPTREIRYINGPTKHDYYFLSQLLNNRRETNVPVFHRYVL